MKNKRVIILLLVMAAAFAYLVLIGMREGSMYYLEVSEFLKDVNRYETGKIRINGRVDLKSLKYDPKRVVLSFKLKDANGPGYIRVRYNGSPPDLIKKDGVTLVAEGSYDKAQGLFVARKLLIKCPSKYESKSDKP